MKGEGVSTDNPLEPFDQSKRFVAEVINLADVRVEAGLPRFRGPKCEHKYLLYCGSDRRIWCRDCERTIDSFDAFMVLTKEFGKMEAAARRKMAQADEAMTSSLTRRATKVIDAVWSGNRMGVCCPHCRGVMLPEDFDHGVAAKSSREIELARRARTKALTPPTALVDANEEM